VGICGGFQMLGEELYDPDRIESRNLAGTRGLGLLPVSTVFDSRKITRQVRAKVSLHSAWGEMAGLELEGYEIRYGKSRMRKDLPSIVALVGEKEELIGLVSPEGDVIGTYLHDLFYNDLFRRRWLNTLRARRGLPPLPEGESSLNIRQRREESYDRLASVLSEHLDLERLYQLIGIGKDG
jgi:adenosylcobyric acid synthase